jgi:hypothetical protein
MNWISAIFGNHITIGARQSGFADSAGIDAKHGAGKKRGTKKKR